MTFNPQLANKIVPWSPLGITLPQSQAIKLHVPPPNGIPPMTLPITFQWANYVSQVTFNDTLGVRVDLSAFGGAQQTIDAIRSIKIDNSKCGMEIFVLFPDTGDMIACPPFSQVISAAYTGILNCVVFANNYYGSPATTTTIQFSNFERQGLVIPPTSVSAPNIAVTGTQFLGVYSGNFPLITNVDWNTPAGADRLLCLFYCGQFTAAGVKFFVPVSIAGVPTSTLCAFSSAENPPNTGVYTDFGIFYALVPAGTGPMQVIINTSGGGGLAVSQFMMFAFSVVNETNPVGVGGLGGAASASATRLAVVGNNIPPGALVLAIAQKNVNSAMDLSSSTPFDYVASSSNPGLVTPFSMTLAQAKTTVIGPSSWFCDAASMLTLGYFI